MTFIQIVSFLRSDPAALREIEEEWLAATEGRRTLLRETVPSTGRTLRTS